MSIPTSASLHKNK